MRSVAVNNAKGGVGKQRARRPSTWRPAPGRTWRQRGSSSTTIRRATHSRLSADGVTRGGSGRHDGRRPSVTTPRTASGVPDLDVIPPGDASGAHARNRWVARRARQGRGEFASGGMIRGDEGYDVLILGPARFKTP